jgi:hypothetical protein
MHVHCDNAMAVGIVNNTVKHQRLHLTEMHYFWVCDKVAQNAYAIKWNIGQENLADYQSKHHLRAPRRGPSSSCSPLVLTSRKFSLGTPEGIEA